MIYEKDTTKIPKKTAEKLSKFSYYVETFFPDFFSMSQKTQEFKKRKTQRPQNKLLVKSSNRNMVYSYFYSKCQNQAVINSQSILSSVKNLYLNQDVVKINQMSYSRQSVFKQSYFPVSRFFSEIIDFVLITEKNQQKDELNILIKNSTSTNFQSNVKSVANNFSKQNITSKNLQPKQYWFYVIHNCNSFKSFSQQKDKISWENFIERYHFTDSSELNGVGTIEYELVYCYKPSESWISFQQNLIKLFIESHCKVNLTSNIVHALQKLQGYLLQRSSQVKAVQERTKDVAFSDEHRRQLKIPIEHFKQYLSLKKTVYSYYKELNNSEQQEINTYFYENLICRYLIAKSYDFEEAQLSILSYLKWEKQFKEKYPSIQCFKQYHALGGFICIGEDFMGRPVILSKAALIDVNKLPDVNMYCDYYIYFFEVFLRTKMRGYVDQMLVIGDLTNLGSNNFKLAITKRNLTDCLHYGPERQHGLVIVHAGSFAYTVWVFIKPLMPKKTLHKIQITGHDKKQILESLTSRMDISVVPEYLGGKNKLDQLFQATGQQPETQKYSVKRIRSSLIIQEEKYNQFQELQLVTTKESPEIKKNSNQLFNLFETVAETFGFKFSS